MRAFGLLFLVACATPAFRYEDHEGVHDVEIEWWYHAGFFGDRYAFFSSFFRKRDPGGDVHRYMIYDLIDLRTGQSRYRSLIGMEAMPSLRSFLMIARTLRRHDPDLPQWIEMASRNELPAPHGVLEGTVAEKPGDALRLSYGPNRLVQTGPGRYELVIQDAVLSLTLKLHDTGSAIYVGGNGLTGVDKPEDMHYYTLPRLRAEGTLTLDGRTEEIQGELWYDHQWGKVWGNGKVGWAWWGIKLDDGEAINLYVLRDLKTGQPVRTVATSSRGRNLTNFRCTPTEFWESPKTRVRYPVAWKIEGEGLDLEITPVFKERELDVLGDYRFIWEGPCVTKPAGWGFQELVGFPLEQKKP
jgi:predicted secreted hydrolase